MSIEIIYGGDRPLIPERKAKLTSKGERSFKGPFEPETFLIFPARESGNNDSVRSVRR